MSLNQKCHICDLEIKYGDYCDGCRNKIDNFKQKIYDLQKKTKNIETINELNSLEMIFNDFLSNVNLKKLKEENRV